MSAEILCPRCGSAVLAETVAGQCPSCLLGVALGADERPEEDDGSACEPRRFGDYVLGRQVGAGGMGVVYEARRQGDDQRVAIKVIRDAHVASPAQLRRFTLEAEAAARLEHPNIVRIHEVGDANGLPYFSMDFVEGESLEAKLRGTEFAAPPSGHGDAGGALWKPTEIARVLAKVARAVHHAHTRGVLHRDLKPANILIDAQGEPHLTDFGLAKLLRPGNEEGSAPALTASGDAPGTPSYMSPEQVSGAAVGCAADVYGLGAVLYAWLTGRPPHRAPTTLELFQQIVGQSPARPRSVNPAIPRDLETICLKCLEKNPRRRYSPAAALAEDLERFAAGRPIAARPAGAGYRTRRWIARNPLGTALIASLCLGLAAALALLQVVDRQRREIELDRDQAFDESMQRISQIWRDPATAAVTISARELAILAGRSPAEVRGARHQLTLGVSADDGPSSMAQRYAHLLGSFQQGMARELGENVALHLRLLKRFNANAATLARGEADFMVLSAVDFLRAERAAAGVVAVARADVVREGVIFARADSGIARLSDLRGRALVLPDPGLSLTVEAKARLRAAGLAASDLRACATLVDQGPESGVTVVSAAETIQRVLRGEADAGLTHRGPFERYRHRGLVLLDAFPETPPVLAARGGLDPALVEALRQAIHSLAASGAWPETRFVSEPAAAQEVAAPPRLDWLRRAALQAEAFERP